MNLHTSILPRAGRERTAPPGVGMRGIIISLLSGEIKQIYPRFIKLACL